MSTNDDNFSDVFADLKVPDHGPAFWDELEARFAAEDGDVTPLGARRRSWTGALSIAAAVAVLLGALGLSRLNLDHASSVNAGQFDSSTTFPTGASGKQVAGPQADVIKAAKQFVDAMIVGDVATAKNLLGPRSEAYLDAAAGGTDAFLTTTSKEYAAWKIAADTPFPVFSVPADPGSFVVEIPHSTPDGEAVEAIPVVHAESADAWFVEPWALDPNGESRIDLTAPDPAMATPTLREGNPITVAIPQDGRVYFALDTSPLVEGETGTTTYGNSSSTTSLWVPTAPVGEHVLIVVYKTDTIFTAFTRTIEIVAR